MGTLPLRTEDRRNQVVALEGMECIPKTPDLELHGKIYGLGDSVCFFDPITGQPTPRVARAALIQAGVVAHNIVEDIKAKEGLTKKASHKTYKPKVYPYILPVGGKYAIAKMGSFIISGLAGWIIKLFVELNYLFSIMSSWRALKIWLVGIKIFIKNDRLG